MESQGQLLPPRPPTLRPLSFGEILDQVFRLYRRRFALFLLLALILTIPVLIFQSAGTAPQLSYFMDLMSARSRVLTLTPAPPPNLPLLGASYLVSLAMVPFSMATIVVAGLRLLEGESVSVGTILRVVLGRYFALFGLAVMLFAIGLSLLCLPVGIWLLVRFSVSVPVMMAERAGPVRALGRSWALTEGGWWRIFGLFVILYLIMQVVSMVLGVFTVPLLLVPFLPAIARSVMYLSISGLAALLVLPLLSIATGLLYVDFRVRKEAYDLEQLARDVPGGTAP
jgi:hypothetical protein